MSSHTDKQKSKDRGKVQALHNKALLMQQKRTYTANTVQVLITFAEAYTLQIYISESLYGIISEDSIPEP